ncbi:MAG: XdhC family protein [Candidatus Hydrogenedentes bacterium]|nr:XdhC family protein [Candidatus Hydrogenedentota bacterium]
MELFRQTIRFIDEGRRFAFSAVIRASGSTPQKAGAKALFEAEGAIHGTLGGGCLEAESRKRALDALDNGRAFAFDLNLNEDYGWDDGLICGGKVRVLVDPNPARHREAFAAAADAIDNGHRGALLLKIPMDGNVESRWVPEAEIESYYPFPGSAELCACLKSTIPSYCVEQSTDGEMIAEVYIEPVEPAPVLLIAGGGHVGQAVARLGAWLGFDVTVVDDRAIFSDAARYPENVRTICGDISKVFASFPIHSNTYIVIVTRGHRHDGVVLKECIHSPARYLGMIGSKRKAHIIREGFLRDGIATETDFARVHSPMGLDIGALTVEEIAMSIVSELVAARRRRSGAAKPLTVYTTA